LPAQLAQRANLVASKRLPFLARRTCCVALRPNSHLVHSRSAISLARDQDGSSPPPRTTRTTPGAFAVALNFFLAAAFNSVRK
jgi:hypothetical protein